MIRTALVACGMSSLIALAGCAGGPGGPGGPGAASDPGISASPAPANTTPAAGSATTGARNKADEPNIGDGVYTAAQAVRGAAVFESVCSECHEPSDWQDQSFLNRWNEDSVFRLWYYIFERMPHGDPMTLSRVQVTDALTYIFELNGIPVGTTELGTDDDSLDDHWIIWGEPG